MHQLSVSESLHVELGGIRDRAGRHNGGTCGNLSSVYEPRDGRRTYLREQTRRIPSRSTIVLKFPNESDPAPNDGEQFRPTSSISKLPLATAHVVRSSVSQHVLHGLLLLDILAVLGDDHTQLTLVVRTIRVLRKDWHGDMGGKGTCEGCCGLEEDDGCFGKCDSRLLRVLDVLP